MSCLFSLMLYLDNASCIWGYLGRHGHCRWARENLSEKYPEHKILHPSLRCQAEVPVCEITSSQGCVWDRLEPGVWPSFCGLWLKKLIRRESRSWTLPSVALSDGFFTASGVFKVSPPLICGGLGQVGLKLTLRFGALFVGDSKPPPLVHYRVPQGSVSGPGMFSVS